MSKTDTYKSKFDRVKWAVVALLLVGGILANGYYADQSLFYRTMGFLVLIIFALLIAAQTARGRTAWQFLQESRLELRKVVWPNRQETVQTTLVVIGMVFVMAILLWVIDAILFQIMSLFTI